MVLDITDELDGEDGIAFNVNVGVLILALLFNVFKKVADALANLVYELYLYSWFWYMRV